MKIPSNKLGHKRIGPYEIKELIGNNAVRLNLPKSLQIHDVINVSRLSPYISPIEGQQSLPPPPIEIQGQEEYEVEQILDSRKRRGKLQFLVKWKGYTDEHNSWEPFENLENAPKVAR